MRDLRTRIAILGCVCSILGCATSNAPPGWLPSPTEVRDTAYGAWIELSLIESMSPTWPLPAPASARSSTSVWKEPSRGSSHVARLKAGEIVNVAEWAVLGSETWYRVEIHDGKSGWARSDQIMLMESGEKIRGEFIAVSDDTLYVLPASRLVAVPAEQVSIIKLSTYDPNVGALSAWTVVGFLSTASHGFYLTLTAPLWLIFGSVLAVNESRAPYKTYDSNVALGDLKIFTRFPQGLPPALDRTAFKPKSRS